MKNKKIKNLSAEPIEALPDFAALKQVKDALWKLGDVHGAAVMIGAGFSRFAKLASATTPKPPLWRDFRDAMLIDLYPNSEGPTDPLMLAEEYRSTLGAGALEAIIRKYVRDNEWEPSELHQNLLRLPWTDVLTTNWDTLLERSSAQDPDASYDVVAVPPDIARARRPRIVKLHGSMPSHLPFIFTEEDFRTYPEKFAPFVNLAQQVLLENELCLVGFSGEDPNFLKWAGWVRDKLGAAARPIRLIGVLDLSPSRRRLFEARNITPIDLSPLVNDMPKEDRHRAAMTLLLDYLWQERPSVNVEWELAEEKDYNLDTATDPEQKIALLTSIWREDRERHPGWLVTPYYQRYTARFKHQDVFRLLANELPKASPQSRVMLLFEVIWRWKTLFWSLPPFLEDIAEKALATAEDRDLPQEHRVLMHSELARLARRRRDWSLFESRMGRLALLPNSEAAHAYESCLRARDELDYAFIAENASRVTGHDPIWDLRRSSLLAEILESKEAARSIQSAFKEIRRRRAQDRRSLWLLSREAWASFMMRRASYELRENSVSADMSDWPLSYKAADTDPWDEFVAQSDDLERAEQRRRADAVDKKPLFDAGHYQVSSKTRFISSASSEPFEQLSFLAEHVGLPLSLGHTDVTGRRWAGAITACYEEGGHWLALRSIVSHDYELLEDHFSRLAIAKLAIDEVEQMAHALRSAITFGRTQFAHRKDRVGDWASRLASLCEVLSRLCVRLNGDQAIECFQIASSLLSDPNIQHWWALKGIKSLMVRSVQALQPQRRAEIALDVLRLPLPNEADFGGPEYDFPDASSLLSSEVWGAREDNYKWNSRISHLLEQCRSEDTDSRRHAIFRLLPLLEAGALSSAESKAFGERIWWGADPASSARSTNLLPHVFLRLPSPDPSFPKDLFAEVVQKVEGGSFDPDLLISLHSASFDLKHQYRAYPLEPETARKILSNLLGWQPRVRDQGDPFVRNTNHEDERTELSIARLLYSTILPAAPSDALDENVNNLIFSRISDGTMPSLLLALPALIQRLPGQADRAYAAVRSGLLSGRQRQIQAALHAINVSARQRKPDQPVIPQVLITEIVSLCCMRREPGFVSALSTTTALVEINAVPEPDRHRLVEAIDVIRTETNYANWEDQTRRSDVGLIRCEAIRLSAALKKSGTSSPTIDAWLDEVHLDPMPEVRYALLEREE